MMPFLTLRKAVNCHFMRVAIGCFFLYLLPLQSVIAQTSLMANPQTLKQVQQKLKNKHQHSKKTVALYFPPKQFSKSMFEYTQVMLSPEYELQSYQPDLPDDTLVIITGYDKAYRFIANKYQHDAIVLGVSSQQQIMLEEARCIQLKHCAVWLYLNNQASPLRVKALQEHFFKTKRLGIATIDWPMLPVWQKTLPDLSWVEGSQQDKPFNVMKKSVEEADVFVLLPDRYMINNTTVRAILQYLYRQKIPTIGYSNSSHVAGSLLSSYANYTQSLLSVKYYLSQPQSNWPKSSYVCYQSYYYNERLARSLGVNISVEKLNQLSEQLDDMCYQ
ncbi:hypothetical protein [Catenovulum adriaticum]|uniref:ABC transporter substrate binding protein n=1 Tax=Catenovulum adriaticum TaxID=2984846 RepID=A0ABY7AHP8_9ALTE|nr:hypothetical protein [Catenovulum sp. TS8]WAJ69142.1 hypothetical protein OLW01_08055 [Catenovulum sp. TS8]